MNELISEKDKEKIEDYDRLKLEYTRLHEDFRRLESRMNKQCNMHVVMPRCIEFMNWCQRKYRYNVNDRLYKTTYHLEHESGVNYQDAYKLFEKDNVA